MNATVRQLEELNVQTLARKNGMPGPAMNEEFGEIGFTSKDREALIRATIKLEEIGRTLDRHDVRFDRIEKERISKEETDRIAASIVKEQNEQALIVAQIEKRLAIVEKQLWKWIAWGGGVCTATGVLVGFAVHFLGQ